MAGEEQEEEGEEDDDSFIVSMFEWVHRTTAVSTAPPNDDGLRISTYSSL
jgi:hypothetical protein